MNYCKFSRKNCDNKKISLHLSLYLYLYLRLYLHWAVSGERCGLLQILETNRDSGGGEAAISNSKRVAESK